MIGIAKDRGHFGVITRYVILVRWVRPLVINWVLVFLCIRTFLWAQIQDKRGGEVEVCILYGGKRIKGEPRECNFVMPVLAKGKGE